MAVGPVPGARSQTVGLAAPFMGSRALAGAKDCDPGNTRDRGVIAQVTTRVFDGNGILTIVPTFRVSTHGEGVGCADSDGDGVLDANDNCPSWPNQAQNLPPWPVPAKDPDCDGFGTTVENSAGTDPLAHCGVNAWPPDIDNDTYVDIVGDIYRVTGQFGNTVPPAPARYDIAPDPTDRFIDVIGDISRMTGLYVQSCAS